MEKIHDNLPPISLPFFTLFDWIIFLVFIGGIVFIFYKIFSSQVKKELQKKNFRRREEYLPTPFILAQELEYLKKLQRKENWKVFALQSTHLLKRILEKKIQKPLFFATGKEIEDFLQVEVKSFSPENIEKIHIFFSILDPIKFSKSENISEKQKISERVINILQNI